jgi:hypothetical protein
MALERRCLWIRGEKKHTHYDKVIHPATRAMCWKHTKRLPTPQECRLCLQVFFGKGHYTGLEARRTPQFVNRAVAANKGEA